MIAEYTSAAYTAQALHWMIQVALPEGLQDTAVRIVGDELAHARLSYECLQALGGEDVPVVLDQARLQMPVPVEGLVAALTDTIVRNFCFGETFAVPLFAEMRKRATHPAARPVLDRVLRDEAVHRAFGWDALDALIELDPGVRARVTARIPEWREAFHRAYGDPPQGPPLLPEEEAMGLIPIDAYARIHDATWRDDVVPRFSRRGIAVPG